MIGIYCLIRILRMDFQNYVWTHVINNYWKVRLLQLIHKYALGIMLYGDDTQMTWSSGADEMFHGFLTYFERLNQLYRDYALNIQKVNESYNESIKLIERLNDTYKEFIENNLKMNQLYKQHFEDMQRTNQQWFNLFWKPFMSRQQEQEKKEDKE